MMTLIDPDPQAREVFSKLYAQQARFEEERPKIEAEGEAALRRLFDVANRDSGQCGIIAKFLLGCYNGERFPFDLTDFRAIDSNLFDDCLAVLKMDARPRREVHTFFADGGQRFEQLAENFGITDYRLLEEKREWR
jgi:hypothetical protein